MTDPMTLVQEKITELGLLYARMDKTRSLLQDQYVFKDYKGNKIDNAISVTRNLAAWQMNTMGDKLVKLEWQPIVESSIKLPKTKIAAIEPFSNDVWAQIDEFLSDELGLSGGHDGWQAKKVVTRGPIGNRICLHYDKDGHLVIDCLPLDMRWCPFELNEWYCNRTWQTAAWLKKTFGESISVSGTSIEVQDFWDNDSEQVFVGGKKVAEKPNPYGKPPFVVILSSVGFQFRDQKYIEYESESFDWLNRNEYDEANRSASIAQTLGMYAFLSAWVQEKDSKVADPPPVPQHNTPYAKGEVPVRVELGDLSAGFVEGAQTTNQDLNRGGVTDTESGNTPGSDTALLTTVRNALLEEKQKPYKDAMAALKQKTLRMVIDQYISLSKKSKVKETEIGGSGMSHSISAEQLGDPSTYRIRYNPMLTSKDQNIANTVTAAGQRGILSLRFILQETLQVQDPDGMIRELDIENAKRADPVIGMISMALSYAKEAKDMATEDADEANLMSMALTDSAVAILKQRDMAALPQPAQLTAQPGVAQEAVKPNLQGIAVLGGPGGNGATPKPAAEMRIMAK